MEWYMNMYYEPNERRHFGIFCDGKQIAHLAEPTKGEPDWSENQEANAHIMAASKLLLEACEYALKNQTDRDVIDKLKFAIAKAKGEKWYGVPL